jgi:hypothetical protein
MSDVLIGLDVGTTGVKAVAITPDGEIVATAEESYPLSTPRPGWAEQDPEDWWRAAEAALAQLPDGPVGFSGQMHGLVALGGADEVLRPAILWNDQRTAAECAEIERRIGLDRLIELTGNRALTGFTAPKLLWLARNEPEIYRRIRRILLPKDYVRLRLTGEHAIDVADASGTLLFDVGARRWSEEVCAALEVPMEWLPPSFESTEIAGAGDQAAGALGVGSSSLVPPRSCSERRVWSSPCFPVTRPTRRRASTSSAMPCRGRGTRWALCSRPRARLRGSGRSSAPGTASSTRRPSGGSRVPRDCCSHPISRASGRRTPTPTSAEPLRVCPFGTTAARSYGRCSRASPTA